MGLNTALEAGELLAGFTPIAWWGLQQHINLMGEGSFLTQPGGLTASGAVHRDMSFSFQPSGSVKPNNAVLTEAVVAGQCPGVTVHVAF